MMDKKEYLFYVKGKVVKTAREYTKFAGEWKNEKSIWKKIKGNKWKTSQNLDYF